MLNARLRLKDTTARTAPLRKKKMQILQFVVSSILIQMKLMKVNDILKNMICINGQLMME
jgi:hypothetical protein